VKIIQNGAITGSAEKAGLYTPPTAWGTTFTTVIYGTSPTNFSDLWGLTWTVADVNPTVNGKFGFALSTKNTGASTKAGQVDKMSIQVYWH
jgi:hypothetical protein